MLIMDGHRTLHHLLGHTDCDQLDCLKWLVAGIKDNWEQKGWSDAEFIAYAVYSLSKNDYNESYQQAMDIVLGEIHAKCV